MCTHVTYLEGDQHLARDGPVHKPNAGGAQLEAGASGAPEVPSPVALRKNRCVARNRVPVKEGLRSTHTHTQRTTQYATRQGPARQRYQPQSRCVGIDVWRATVYL